ncbi:MAG: hypothetical protein JST54_27645 [Deltaproteobacteria bacterium]|nr:hypothetical protein [Deltaproteobacteria bacterium]
MVTASHEPPATSHRPAAALASNRWTLVKASALLAFLVFHIVAITVRALPAPDGAMDRSTWSDPTVQQEMSAWTERLGQLGIKLSSNQLQDALYVVAGKILSARDTLVSPFGRYYDWCGTFQSWQMFVAPHRHPARVRVDVQEHGVWRTVFRERDPNATWLASELGDTRFRSLFFRVSWPNFRGMLERIADYVARRAAVDFPDATRVQLVLSRAETPTPDEVKRGELPREVDDTPVVRDLARWRRAH